MAGIYLYSLADPANPSFLSSAPGRRAGIHTVTFGDIGGRRYAFAAGTRNPAVAAHPALLIYDVTDPERRPLVATEAIPRRDYGIHDTFVRDGLAFVFAWDTGADHL